MIRFRDLAAGLVDALLPPLCLHCEAPLRAARPGLCPACLSDLEPLGGPGCRRCGLPRPGDPRACSRCRGWPAGLSAVAGVRYAGVARTIVAGIKFGGWIHLGETCAEPMARALEDAPRLDALVPVPLHPSRLRERGFNQARVLAESLGRRLDVGVEDVLVRERATTSQVGLDRAARRSNVRGAFSTRRSARRIEQGTVGLVDDVATSGATLAAAAEPLLEAGAASVVGVSFALAFIGVPA